MMQVARDCESYVWYGKQNVLGDRNADDETKVWIQIAELDRLPVSHFQENKNTGNTSVGPQVAIINIWSAWEGTGLCGRGSSEKKGTLPVALKSGFYFEYEPIY